jgi:ketosteroid isomerase-like protein
MSMTAAEILGGVYLKMSQGDWEGVEALLADDFTIVEPESLPYGGLWKGKDALQRLHPAVMQYFDDPAPVIKEVIGGKEWASVIVDFTVTSKKTGRRFTQTVSEVGRVADGKLAELQIHYFDTAEIAAEIG